MKKLPCSETEGLNKGMEEFKTPLERRQHLSFHMQREFT